MNTQAVARSLSRRPRGWRMAFSIAEVLVAMAVLSLITVIVAQLVNSSSSIALGSRKRLDAEGQARLVLTRIGEDIARMVHRSDVDCLFVSASGNDSMYFFSEAPAAFDTATDSGDKSAVALVGYRIAGSSGENAFRLERLGKGLKWSGSTSGKSDAVVLVSYSTNGAPLAASRLTNSFASVVGTAPSYNSGTDSTYQLFSDSVIRLEVAFLKKDGTLTQDPGGTGSKVATSLKDVSAIIVTIAVLDESSQKVLSNSQISQIATALSDPATADFTASPPVLMAKKWQGLLASPTFASSAGVPASIVSQIRVYQRIYPLNAL